MPNSNVQELISGIELMKLAKITPLEKAGISNADRIEAFCTVAGRYNISLNDFMHAASILKNFDDIDEGGEPLLFYAIRTKHLEAVEYLISKGANPHRLDANGCSSVGSAARAGSLPIIQLLVEKHGVDVNLLYTDIGLHKCGLINALYTAVVYRNAGIVNYLAPRTNDINLIYNFDDGTTTTLLFLSCLCLNPLQESHETFEALLQHLPDVTIACKARLWNQNVNLLTQNNCTPFLATIFYGQYKAFWRLIQLATSDAYAERYGRDANQEKLFANLYQSFTLAVFPLAQKPTTANKVKALFSKLFYKSCDTAEDEKIEIVKTNLPSIIDKPKYGHVKYFSQSTLLIRSEIYKKIQDLDLKRREQNMIIPQPIPEQEQPLKLLPKLKMD